MENIIRETEIMAYDHFKAFGFNEEQISSLIDQGKKDLRKELGKLKTLLAESEKVSLDEINNSLHALKGLFAQFGNQHIAEQINEIRTNDKSKVILKKLSELLFS
jgi:hypothetical protein